MDTKKRVDEEKFFIVRKDELSAYGDEKGSTALEAEELLRLQDCSDLVVIKGVLIPPTFVLE